MVSSRNSLFRHFFNKLQANLCLSNTPHSMQQQECRKNLRCLVRDLPYKSSRYYYNHIIRCCKTLSCEIRLCKPITALPSSCLLSFFICRCLQGAAPLKHPRGILLANSVAVLSNPKDSKVTKELAISSPVKLLLLMLNLKHSYKKKICLVGLVF